MLKCKVTGEAGIVGVDGETVLPGGYVVLDETVINVQALVMSGHVEPGTPVKPEKPKPEGDKPET